MKLCLNVRVFLKKHLFFCTLAWRTFHLSGSVVSLIAVVYLLTQNNSYQLTIRGKISLDDHIV